MMFARIAMAAVLAAASGLAMADEMPKPKREADWPKVEEKALRPYKGFFRGIRAFAHHTVTALAEGNEKLPVFGSVEVFRGVRKGTVELASSTYMGMMGARHKPYDYYSKPNVIIDSDPLLYHAADFATPLAMGTLASGVRTGLQTAVVVKAGHQITDSKPFIPDAPEPIDLDKHRVAKAQERYIGKRAAVNAKTDGSGNLLKLAKK